MTLSVLADQERQLQIWKVLKQAFVPKRCALGAGWLVAAIFAGAGIAEPHGKDGNFCFIVEDRALKLQPLAQAITAGIIPRYPSLVDFAPRSLTGDQNASAAGQLQNRTST
jgi:hypothetical protein